MKNGIIKMLALLLLGTATLSGCAIENNRPRRYDRYHHYRSYDRYHDNGHYYRNY
jgi:hypothetical protein